MTANCISVKKRRRTRDVHKNAPCAFRKKTTAQQTDAKGVNKIGENEN